MGTPILIRRARNAAAQLAALLLVLLVACETDPAGPGGTTLGHLQISPQLLTSVDPERLGLDEIHVTVIREWDSTTVVDTTVAYNPAEDDVFGWVLNLDTPSDLMTVRAEVLSNGVVFFAAESTLVVDESAVGESEVQSVTFPFVGPGWNVESLEIDPGDSVVSNGDVAQFRVAAIDSAGEVVTDPVVVWETSNPAVATIDTDALLQAPSSGRSSVQVIAQTPTGISDSANVKFIPLPDSLIVISGDADSVEAGTEVQLAVQVLGTDGLGVEQVAVTFAAPEGASVVFETVITGQDGMASTVGTVGTLAGEYQFSATVEGLPEATLIPVAVAGPAESLEFSVVPETASVNVDLVPAVEVRVTDSFGNTDLTATHLITLGLEANVLDATLLGNTSVQAEEGVARFESVRIDRGGDGFRLVAEADGLLPATSGTVDVAQSVEALTVDPTETTLTALADTVTLDAVALDGAGNEVHNARIDWASSDEGVVSVNGAGLVTAVGNGTATITLTSGNATATATITVAQEVVAIELDPSEFTLTQRGSTRQIMAVANDRNGFPVAEATLEWSTTDDAVAAVNDQGTVTAIDNGQATIVVTSGNISGQSQVAVDVPIVDLIVVTPSSGSLDAVKASILLEAQAFDQDGNPLEAVLFEWTTSDETIATVDDDGLVAALANGTATVTASSGDEAGSASVEVQQVAASVLVTPNRTILNAVGETFRYEASVYDANGFAMIGAPVEWSSSDEAVASIDPSLGEVTAVGTGASEITAFSGDATGTAIVEVDIPVLESITVSPGIVSLSFLSETQELQAEARDNYGSEMADVDLQWSSLDPTVATVDENGNITAVANGSTTVVAASGSVSGSAEITVLQEVATISVSPSSVNLVSLRETADLSATAWDAGGSEIADAEFTWESTADVVASVDSDGQVIAESNGSANVFAAIGDVSGSAAVTVSQEAASIAVTPESATLVSLGQSAQFSATAWDAGGSEMTDVEFNWTSSAEDVASVGSSGSAVAVSNGSATVTVASGDVSATAEVTVSQVVAAVTVSPDAAGLASLGESVDLTASAWDADGSEIVGVSFTWLSSDEGVATVGATGRVSAVSNGASTISATADGITAGSEVTVRQEIESVAITPTTANLTSLGESVQLTATAWDAGGNVVDGAEFTWESSRDGVSTVAQTGSATAVANGSATITATADGLVGSAEVTVEQVVTLVTVNPTATTLVSLGQTAEFEATAWDEGGSEVVGAEFRWVSSADGVATVSDIGEVRAVSNGSATISAFSGEASGDAGVTVEQDVVTVSISPSAAELSSLGESTVLTAIARDAGGSEIPGAEFDWQSSTESVATVGTDGSVLARANGATIISASADGVSSEAQVTVEQQVVSISVAPETVSLTSYGEEASLTATALDARGNAVVGASIDWASSASGIASVDLSGTVTAVANGSASVSATSGTISGSAGVTVQQVVASVTVDPTESELVSLGESVEFQATAWDEGGSEIVDADFVWSSAVVSVATVEQSGSATAVSNGSTTISAVSGSATGSAALNVQQVAASMSVTPGSANFVSIGESTQFAATAWDAGGSEIVGADFVWTSSNGLVVSVGTTGIAAAVSNGSATITAAFGDVTDNATVIVDQEIVSVTVTPPSANLVSIGETVELLGTAWDSGGSPVSNADFVWESSATGIATVTSAGVVSAMANGFAEITATAEGVSGNADVLVAQEVAFVSLTPPTANLASLGESVDLTATAWDGLGTEIADATFEWNTSAAGIASVTDQGTVSAVGNGSAEISATSGGVSGLADITVQQVVATVDVDPTSVELNSIGETAALGATVRDSRGNEIVGASVTWSIEGEGGIASVGAQSGIVEALGNGAVSAVATSDTVSGSAAVTVSQVAASIDVAPSEATLTAIEQTLQLSATVRDANGYEIEGASVTWAACPAPLAGDGAPAMSTGVPGCAVIVNQNGLVTAIAEGVATVRASYGDVHGEAEITVALGLSRLVGPVDWPGNSSEPRGTNGMEAAVYVHSSEVVATKE